MEVNVYQYNLVDEPVLPVLVEGVAAEVSLRQALLDAPRITAIAATPATMGPALFRHLVLAVVLDALGAPKCPQEWKSRWDAGSLDGAAVEGYLDQHLHRFDLFSPTVPFAQVADLHTPAGEFKPASGIVPSIPGGHSTPLFGSRTDADPIVLTPAEATRWLVHLLAYDTAGIKSAAVGDDQAKGGKAYGNPVGPLGQLGVVVPVGRNLFETIMLNLPILSDGLSPSDSPHWRRPAVGATWDRRQPVGLLDLLTWLGRRVRLVPEEGVNGTTMVRQVVLTAGDQMLSIPRYEPHTSWRRIKQVKPGESDLRPLRHSSDRALWQGLGALLELPSSESTSGSERSVLLQQVADLQVERLLDDDYPLNLELVSCEYGTQSAVVDNVVSDELPVPVAVLAADLDVGEAVDEIAASANELVEAVNILHGDLRRAAGGDPVPWNSGQRPGVVLVQQLDPHVRRILSGLQRQPERVAEGRQVWSAVAGREARSLGDELLASVPPSAWTGRVIEVNGRERTFRATSAELAFRRRIKSALARFAGDPISLEEAG